MTFFEFIKSIFEKIKKTFDEKYGIGIDPVNKPFAFEHAKEAYGLYNMKVRSKRNKYAIYNDSFKKCTPYIYDDVLALSRKNIVLTTILPDGNIRYAIASANYAGIATDAVYVNVSIHKGTELLATDESGKKFIVDENGLISKYL